jgi:guanylate kinase
LKRNKQRYQVLLIAGPQGVGKTYLANRLVDQSEDFVIAPGIITRSARGTQDGNDTQVTPEEFHRMRDNHELCLEATVGEHRYAYLRDGIERALAAGKRVIVLLLYAQDVVEAGNLWPGALRVYLRPANWELLRHRLTEGRRLTGGEADQILGAGRRVVDDLDPLGWDLQVDVAEATDPVAAVVSHLKASR